MDMHELARVIAVEVLARLGSARPVGATGPGNATLANVPSANVAAGEWAMVIGERGADLSARVTGALGAEVGLVFLGENLAGRKPCHYIVPFLSCADMAGLACGRAVGRVAEETLRLLLSGVKVHVLEFEYKAWRETAPSSLYALYEGHEKTLASYGLVAWRKKREAWRSAENLITEKHVLEAGKDGAALMIVPARAIITPLAMDAARELNMVFERR